VLYLLTSHISSVFVQGQLGFLVDEGFDVMVGTSLEGLPERPSFDAGVRVVHVPFVREPSPVADLRALRRTRQLIGSARPAIVNASTPKAGLLGMLAARISRVPVRVYLVRGLRFETMNGWRRSVFRRLEWLSVRCATHVLFDSPSLMAVAERENVVEKGRGHIIGNGSTNGAALSRFVDLPDRATARQILGLPLDAPVVGFVGRFTADKGIADLYWAVKAELDRRPRLSLLLVGAFEDGDPIDRSTRSMIEQDPRVVIVPWLDSPGVAYRAMDVLVFPSYREGFANVPLEAQLCGTPVVGYAATGTVDAVSRGHTGVLVEVGDVEGLRREVGQLLDDSQRRAAMGVAGRDWVLEHFDQGELWAALASCYREWLDDEER
jgi:glycosyltransferase involved in cell wall biosynthesis